ncbi:hypothetical protein OF001_U420004 [Pseudomonas sp. OF001]|nr:hypothetical protein OF001_U420004 [Pseudomonas sp. OF001]
MPPASARHCSIKVRTFAEDTLCSVMRSLGSLQAEPGQPLAGHSAHDTRRNTQSRRVSHTSWDYDEHAQPASLAVMRSTPVIQQLIRENYPPPLYAAQNHTSLYDRPSRQQPCQPSPQRTLPLINFPVMLVTASMRHNQPRAHHEEKIK